MISGAALRESDQMFTVEMQVYQREAGAQSVVVFHESPVADLIEAEDAFQGKRVVWAVVMEECQSYVST